jgi:UDP-N-acetylmuramate--alanine ligase
MVMIGGDIVASNLKAIRHDNSMKNCENIHFVGIGGIGMSALARMVVSLGYKVSGSDIKDGRILGDLRKIGINVQIGHRAENVASPDCIVVSSSIRPDNPELMAARALGIPVVHRGEMLAILMDAQRGIAISGTHGKSTTTAMLAYILEATGWDPSTYIGAIVPKYKSNAKTGLGDWFLTEADESDESFLKLNPEIAVITNIDSDHMDHYGNRKALLTSFRKFLEKLPSKGFGVISADDSGIAELGGIFGRRLVTFGIENFADCMAENITSGEFTSTFDLVWRGDNLGTITIHAPGIFNVQNAIAAAATALTLGVEFEPIKAGLEEYRGISRRFEIHKNNGFMVVDDYAHHPTEIKATLSGARENTTRRIIAVFQPHRYTRTQFLQEEYGLAFDAADIVVVTDIYSAGERPIENVSSRLIVDSIRKNSGTRVVELGSLDDVMAWLKDEVRPGDIIITLGAGDVHKVAESLAQDPTVCPEAQLVPHYHIQTG